MTVAAATLRTNSLLVAGDPPKYLLNAVDNQARTQLMEDIKENVMAWTKFSHPQTMREAHPQTNPLPKGTTPSP